ncbi:TSC22 domain family protein 4 isoform X2 [Gymnodraco acuticeps]|uniref:TSC22 domain family protein 4 isoform X2 n=2 Tax=Notothenioidei TaxID=8205 RepID=A0A6P8W6K1_GYMAC|nr:TSC22 domain family protein 4 isoform X2 [Gymnodraco acuticeps]
MSGGKKRSGFQITSVTSDFNQTPAGQSAPSMVLTVVQSAQRSSSQPTTPSLKRKHVSHDAAGQGGGASRFRVVRLVLGAGGRGQPYRRGRWTCTDIQERQEGAGLRCVMDTMRHAHSLESLEMIGRDVDRGAVYTQDSAHLLTRPIRGQEGAGLVPRSRPLSLTHQEPMVAQSLNSAPPPPSPRPRNVPPPLRLDVDSAGRSVLRLSHSQPSSPPVGSYHPTQTPSVFCLDRTMFDLPGDARMLKLVAKQPEMVVLRERRRVRGHVTGSRESWPGAAPPPAASHWSVPVRAPPSGRGSEASMMSLMLLCHR